MRKIHGTTPEIHPCLEDNRSDSPAFHYYSHLPNHRPGKNLRAQKRGASFISLIIILHTNI
jgi:hypothetical protein